MGAREGGERGRFERGSLPALRTSHSGIQLVTADNTASVGLLTGRGDQVRLYASRQPVDLTRDCFMAEMWSIMVSHSAMVGVSGVFQCLEMTALARLSKCRNILLCILDIVLGIIESKVILG